MGQPLPHITAQSRAEAGVGAGTLRWPVGCGAALGWDGPSNRGVVFRSPGTLDRSMTRIIDNTTNGPLFVVLQKNGVDTSLAITIGTGLTGDFEDVVNGVPVASGDEFLWRITSGGGAVGGYTLNGIRVAYTAAGATVSRVVCNGNADMGAGTAYFPIWGVARNNWGAETATQVMTPVAGTARNLAIRIDQNITTGASTGRFRKNNANTALAVTIGVGLTGVFEDITNSEPVDALDLLNHVIEGGGGTNLSVTYLAMDFESPSTLSITGGSASQAHSPTTTPVYTAFQGRYDEWAVEADMELTLGEETDVLGLGTNVQLNTSDSATYVKLRKNGVDANNIVTIGAGLTGHFIDLDGQDHFLATDKVNLLGVRDSLVGLFSATTFYYAFGLIPAPVCPGEVQTTRIDGIGAPYPPSLCPPGGSGTLGAPNIGV